MTVALIGTDLELVRNPFFQFGHVTDDPDHARIAFQSLQRLQCIIQRGLIQRAEAFINKQSINLNSPGLLLNDLAKLQRQGQRGSKSLPSRQGMHAAILAGITISDADFQSAPFVV